MDDRDRSARRSVGGGSVRRVSGANHALRRAREATASERLPGCSMSRDELAARINAWLRTEAGEVFVLDERAIGRWERGAVQLPSEHYRALCARCSASNTTGNSASGPDPAEASPRGKPVDCEPPTVEAIRAMASSLQIVDRRLGGGRLCGSVVSYLQADVARALFASGSGAQVFATAASMTEIAGWMAHDSGRDVDARTHFDGSFRLALAAGSAALAANMCASMAHLAGQLGQVDDAIRLADVDLDRASETGGVARVVARLHAMRAKGLALRGDSAGCLEGLVRAERALGGDNDNEHAAW